MPAEDALIDALDRRDALLSSIEEDCQKSVSSTFRRYDSLRRGAKALFLLCDTPYRYQGNGRILVESRSLDLFRSLAEDMNTTVEKTPLDKESYFWKIDLGNGCDLASMSLSNLDDDRQLDLPL